MGAVFLGADEGTSYPSSKAQNKTSSELL